MAEGMTNKVDVSVDTRGMNCPQPLIEARKKMRKMAPGQVLEVIGDHAMSRKEIPMAMQETGDKVLEVKDEPGGGWKIYIQKGG
jgi:tRNA 2-thiouridine synthesizing protein A